MERDSRAWKLKCNTCSHEKSFWDIGGIRWKAKGNQKNYLTCEKCGTMRWHTAYKKQETEIK